MVLALIKEEQTRGGDSTFKDRDLEDDNRAQAALLKQLGLDLDANTGV